MPRKSDTIPINNKLLDRRCKLTDEQKQEIRRNKLGLSQRRLAAMYEVSRRTIQFILNPDSLKENLERRKERGGSKQYYDKEKNTNSTREHRNYKKDLFSKGLIGNIKTKEGLK